MRLEDFSDNIYQTKQNSNSYGTIKDENSKKKEEEIREEKNEDDDWKSETPPVVIALSVITCGSHGLCTKLVLINKDYT